MMGPTTEHGLYVTFEALAEAGVLTIAPGYVETRHGAAPGVQLLVDGRLLLTISRRRFLRALQIELVRDYHRGDELLLEPDEDDAP